MEPSRPANDPMARVARNHAEHRTIVLAEYRLLYLPVPKTGWTSTLWALAGLAGLTAEDFERSVKPEVSTVMAVHDEAVWSQRRRVLRALDAGERAEALDGDDWLRFTVVRDPARRLWSAWQSKFLLREPVYYGFHRDRAWYPHRPDDPRTVVADFRAFVHGLAAGFTTEPRLRDPHWGPQSDVLAQLPLNHVGRAERTVETEAAVQAHVTRLGGPPIAFVRENATSLPYSAALWDADTASTVADLYAADFAAFGYDPPQALSGAEHDKALAAWCADAGPQLPRLDELVDRHRRLYDVVTEFRRRVGDLEQQRRNVEAELVTTQDQLDQALARNRRLTGSMSWRATAPLRRLRRWSRR